jgi:ribosome-associated toxin RatA of RatAB toxin-antitoxin module
MRQIRRSALVPATPQRMFALINDIDRYPEFVPGCMAARVLERTTEALSARLTVGSGALQATFTTRNHLLQDQQIRMSLLEGPFKSLEGVWLLTPVADTSSGAPLGCQVELQLDFELRGGMMGLTLGPLMERMARSLVDAFVRRAATESPIR